MSKEKEKVLEPEIEEEQKAAETESEPTAESETKSESESTAESETAAESEKDAEKTAAEDDAKYLRLMADFQNYKRRVEKEKGDIYSMANEKLILKILEVMDNFERALEHDAEDGFKEGMQLIFNQLKTVLEKEGLEEIPSENADFDPNFHNAVMMEETDAVESGKISAVLQKGYTLKGKVIRPSMVKVAK